MPARTPSRRDVLKAAGALAGLRALGPLAFRGGTAWGASVDPATRLRYRLVVVDLGGGNDGLNTVVPKSGPLRSVYEAVRVGTRIERDPLLTLGDTGGSVVGLNPNLSYLHRLWTQDRVAVVQGVDYDNPNYSHFIADDIWQSGTSSRAPRSGWLGRHLDRVTVPDGELRGVGVAGTLPLALYGANAAMMGQQVGSLGDASFRDGPATTGHTGARHAAFAGYDAATGGQERYGDTCRSAYDLAAGVAGIKQVDITGLTKSFLTARALLTANLGVEVVFVSTSGYDTHEKQPARHAALLRALDLGLEGFWNGTQNGTPIKYPGTTTDGPLPGDVDKVVTPGSDIGPLDADVAERTLVLTFSEFGRRIGDTGDGTDHGAAAPLFLVGPPRPPAGSGKRLLVPGLHRDHPDMGSVLAPEANLMPTTDFRNVYQSVLTGWLGTAGDDEFRGIAIRDGVNLDGTLAGLFGTA